MEIVTLENLQGHDVFEFMQGAFKGEHWHSSSIYFTEESFNPLYLYIIDVIPSFNYFGPNHITNEQWGKVMQTIASHTRNTNENNQALVDFLYKVDAWVQTCLKKHGCFTICGP